MGFDLIWKSILVFGMLEKEITYFWNPYNFNGWDLLILSNMVFVIMQLLCVEEGFSGGILSCYSHIWFVKWDYLVALCCTNTTDVVMQGCVYALFDWKIKEVLGFCSHYLYHSSLHMHSVWGLAVFYSMVDCEWYWNCLDGFARWISVYQTRTPGDTNTTISFK